MTGRRRRVRKADRVSASELAQMGVCERRVKFEHDRGRQRTPEQLRAMERGLRAHETHYRDGQHVARAGGRCFVAMLLFGEAPETGVLRCFRDQVMRPRPLGRRFIVVYYRFAPAVCRFLDRCPSLLPVARWLVRGVVRSPAGGLSGSGVAMVASVPVALLAVASILGVAWWLSKWHRAGSTLVNLPRELREARLLYAEQLFTAAGQPSISARVDRAYRLPSGAVVLLELKTRAIDRPYLSDLIELSAQRAAVVLQTGETVADHAYVAVRRPGSAVPRFHRVRLMPIAEVKGLAVRRETILVGRLAPSYAGSVEICRRCPFASGCEKPHRSGLRRNA